VDCLLVGVAGERENRKQAEGKIIYKDFELVSSEQRCRVSGVNVQRHCREKSSEWSVM
jgi:hypothetical protein